MKFCGNCGNKLNEEEMFCSKCGSLVNGNNVVPTQPQVVVVNGSNDSKSAAGTIVSIVIGIIIIGVIIFIAIPSAKKNADSAVDNSRRSSMRTTAQKTIDGVRLQLTSNYELFPGTYGFTKDIIENQTKSAPFGGEYAYYTEGKPANKIGGGVYKINDKKTNVYTGCNNSKYSYIVVDREDDKYNYYICLTTTNKGQDGGYLAGSRAEVDDTTNKSIFYGKAAE